MAVMQYDSIRHFVAHECVYIAMSVWTRGCTTKGHQDTEVSRGVRDSLNSKGISMIHLSDLASAPATAHKVENLLQPLGSGIHRQTSPIFEQFKPDTSKRVW